MQDRALHDALEGGGRLHAAITAVDDQAGKFLVDIAR